MKLERGDVAPGDMADAPSRGHDLKLFLEICEHELGY